MTVYDSPCTALFLTISLALAAATVLSARTSSIGAGMGAAVANATTLHQGDVFAGVLPHTQPMHIMVALKLRNRDQLDSLIAAHQTLAPKQFSALHAPTLLQAQAVATYLTQMGFRNVVISTNRMLITADGTAGTAQAAFHTSFARVQTHDGRAAFANNSDAYIPTSLQDSVLSVTGLQSVHQPHTFAQRAKVRLGDGASPAIASGGQVGQLIFYAMPTLSDADLLADFNTAVTANVAKIINVSMGECETSAAQDGAAAASDQIFQVGVAQGQTFSIATGDEGANECLNEGMIPSWPADSPYVVAVGGTTLTATTTMWINETVWADAGGSPSTFELKPSWQNSLVPGTKRGLPDIAMDADSNSGANVYVDGGLQQWGGTSLAAPIFAGLWARMIAIKGAGIGFAAPQLYELPATDFHDVTTGNNRGETAKPGYDFASGRGSVVIRRLAGVRRVRWLVSSKKPPAR